MPVSAISSTAFSSRDRTFSQIVPPSGVYLIALSRRFTTTCLSRTLSPSTSTPGSISRRTVNRFSSLKSSIWHAIDSAISPEIDRFQLHLRLARLKPRNKKQPLHDPRQLVDLLQNIRRAFGQFRGQRRIFRKRL